MISDTLGKVAVVGSGIPRPYLVQGVVTYASPVEAFVTRIKMESSDQRSFLELIKGSRRIQSD